MLENVFVVIVTFNGEMFIDECLKSVYQSLCTLSVVVVDNNSSDNTIHIIEKKYSQTKLIRNNKNEGFGGANNRGIDFALANKASYVFLLNQDTIVDPEAIPTLRDFLKDRNDFALVSPVHLNDIGDDLDAGFRRYVCKEINTNELSTLHQPRQPHLMQVSFVNAAAWMVKAEAFRLVGGFAPLFFHYGEDRDFVNRVHYQKMKIGIVKGTFIKHIRQTRDGIGKWNLNRLIKYYKTGWISRASDVNRSLINGWVSGLVWTLKESIIYLLRGNIKVFIGSVIAFVELMFLLPKIVNHRNEARRSTHFKFLSCALE